MTEQHGEAGDGLDAGRSVPFESAGSAHDDALGDSLAMDSAMDGQDGAAPDLPTAASPPPPPPRRRGRHRPGDGVAHPHDGAAHAAAADGATDSATDGATDGATTDGATTDGATGRRKHKRKRRKAPWWELPLLIGFAIVIAIVVKSFVIQPFYIPSQSMEKTLHGCPGCKGDRILVNKPIYDLRDPHGGDIVVFHAPNGWDDEPPVLPPSNPVLKGVRGFGQLVGLVPPDGLVLVKRVIATGGQGVQGDSAGHVMISDHGTSGPWRTLNEPYVFEDGTDSHAAFGPVVVPKGRLWVMGDHRNDSADSRFHCGAGGSQGSDGPSCDPISSTVPDSAVIGKAVVIAWPPSRWRTLGTPATFKHAADAALPVGGGVLFVLPVYVLRRRRRRRG
ncbi:MAG: signal peptidase [Pseudonocardiales bacterium]|nr:signal peptidase [Pseudonocardiales bacterium]